jgi:hypothetical protein
MPDFDAMTDLELRQWRFAKNQELNAIRDEIRAAGKVLERKRAEADRAEYDASVAMYGADAVAAASKIVVTPPASAESTFK